MKPKMLLLQQFSGYARRAAATPGGKNLRSIGGTCLLSFVVSGLATLLVCASAPVRSVPLQVLPKHLKGSDKAELELPRAKVIHVESGQ